MDELVKKIQALEYIKVYAKKNGLMGIYLLAVEEIDETLLELSNTIREYETFLKEHQNS